MFNLKSNYEINRPLLKENYRRYNPTSLSTINTNNSLITIQVPREDAYICLKDSYIDLEIEIVKNDNSALVNASEVSLINLGGVALFQEAKLTTSSNKQIERVEPLYQSSLMYKLLSSSHTSDMSCMFEKDYTSRKAELTTNADAKGVLFLQIKLSDLFGFAEYQDKITLGLGYNLTLRRGDDANALLRLATMDACKILIKQIAWVIPHYTPSIENQTLVAQQLLNKEPTTLKYVERKSFTKAVNTNNNWTFEIGVEAGIEIPIYVIVSFQTRTRYSDQEQDNGLFDRPNILSASCSIGSERYPEDRMNIDYSRNNYLQAYGEIKNFWNNHVGEHLLDPRITKSEFKNDYNFYVFDLRHQKEHLSAQPIKLEFQLQGDVVRENYVATALVLTNKLVSVSSDGQKMFDLI